MKVTPKPMQPIFLSLFVMVIMMVIYFIYDLSSSQPLTLSPKKAELQFADKQLIVNLTSEIVSLKEDVKRINNKLSQLSSNDANLETALTEEQIQTIEASNNNYEIAHEENRINSANQIEDYFADQVENTAMDANQEATIRQSLAINKNDMASIVDLHCKSSLCRLELKYDLTAFDVDYIEEGGNASLSPNISKLLDVAVSQEINEVNQTAVAVIFLGQLETDLVL
jgi:predicted RNase H-like nuclease (RuvC/YqgF family)